MCCGTANILQLNTGGAGNTLYSANDTLAGNRVVNMGSFDLTFNGGGNFIIDGKLTVTGLIDPTGLVLTQEDPANVPVALTEGAMFVGNGSGGTTAGELYYKTSAGVSDLILRQNTSSVMAGATALVNGEIGAVPQPLLGEEGLFLRGDGTWAAAGGTNNIYDNDGVLTGTRAVIIGANTLTFSSNDGGGNQAALVISPAGGVSLTLLGSAALSVNGTSGTSGQVLTSQGVGAAPIWANAATSNFATGDLTATANRTHDWATFDYVQSNFGSYQLQSVGNATVTVNSNITLDAATVTLTSPTGQYVLGDGTAASLPTTNSDSTNELLSIRANGTVDSSNRLSFRNLTSTIAPTDGNTIAWYVGQEWHDTTSGITYRAATASTDPDATVNPGTGSVWVVKDYVIAPHEQTFNATTDWGVATGGYYEITIVAATHAKANIGSVQVWQGTTDFDLVMPDRVRVNVAGDVLLRVTETPDNRFAGKVVIT